MSTACTCNEKDHEYEEFQKSLMRNFDKYSLGDLFTTNADGLWEAFLGGIDEEYRQHYNCNACKNFIRKYGGLVAIDESGRVAPSLWDANTAPDFFLESVMRLRHLVRKARITGVFFDKVAILGTPITGEWEHMFVIQPPHKIFKHPLKTAGQAAAEKKEDFKNIIRALVEFPIDAVNQAVNLLDEDHLSRPEKVLGQAVWLKDLHESIDANKGLKSNIVWAAIASAPAGFCHPRSSVIGTLLEDIIEGVDFNLIKRRFDEKMHGLNYQRPKAAPTVANIAEAEKIIAKLGVAKSLDRRFAKIGEIPLLWKPTTQQVMADDESVFGHLEAKDDSKIKEVVAPPKKMTWKKFLEEVIPSADTIEFAVPPNYCNYAAILAANDADAPPILQWDSEESRNSFSWYLYSGGSSASKWCLKAGAIVKVTGICQQPSMWSDGNSHQGKGIIFILEGAKDSGYDAAGNGLFPEILKSEFRGIRSTIEAYSKGAKLKGYDDASACGVVLNAGSEHDYVFRVKSGANTNQYRIDRWD